jgi:hypothetical protein
MTLGFAVLLAGIVAGLAIAPATTNVQMRGLRFELAICLAFAFPLAGYLGYLRFGYLNWNWAPFSHDSLIPIIGAGISASAAAFWLYDRRGLATKWAALIALALLIAFGLVALLGGLAVSCSMGDCI